MALLCAALAWQRRQNEDGDMLTESDTESDEGVDRPVINAKDKENLPSFDDFRYSGPKDIGSAARSKHGREGKAVVELGYEETEGSKGGVSATGHVKQRLLSDDDDVFESPKKKRTKSSSYVAPPTDGKICPNEDMRKNIDTTADGTYTEALSVTSDTPSNAIKKGHSTMKSPAASKPSAEGESPIVKKKGEPRKRRAKIKRKRPRRVYFCSRTHSQLTQVVAELRKCVEACPGASAVHIGEHGQSFKMSLLASRKSTCINKTGAIPRTASLSFTQTSIRSLGPYLCNLSVVSNAHAFSIATFGWTLPPLDWDVSICNIFRKPPQETSATSKMLLKLLPCS